MSPLFPDRPCAPHAKAAELGTSILQPQLVRRNRHFIRGRGPRPVLRALASPGRPASRGAAAPRTVKDAEIGGVDVGPRARTLQGNRKAAVSLPESIRADDPRHRDPRRVHKAPPLCAPPPRDTPAGHPRGTPPTALPLHRLGGTVWRGPGEERRRAHRRGGGEGAWAAATRRVLVEKGPRLLAVPTGSGPIATPRRPRIAGECRGAPQTVKDFHQSRRGRKAEHDHILTLLSR